MTQNKRKTGHALTSLKTGVGPVQLLKHAFSFKTTSINVFCLFSLFQQRMQV